MDFKICKNMAGIGGEEDCPNADEPSKMAIVLDRFCDLAECYYLLLL